MNIYNLIGIGIGPYNLSLAVMLEKVPGLTGLFFDKTPEFSWHPGMLIEGSEMQVPFLDDLVTLADPTSPYTYLNYLHEHDRLTQFSYFHRLEIPRKEYNHYCQWAASNLDNCRFGMEVADVQDREENGERFFEVTVLNMDNGQEETYFAYNLILGTGNEPLVPDHMKDFLGEDCIHSSRYLQYKDKLAEGGSISVIGSGQSAAEIFYDLLQCQKTHDFQLNWLARSAGFLQLESTKLGQEFFSPEYVNYFHSLPYEERIQSLDTLNGLRNGIEPGLLDLIYKELYHQTIGGESSLARIQPHAELQGMERTSSGFWLQLQQKQSETPFKLDSDKVVLATGYRPHLPDWLLSRYGDEIIWEGEREFKVSLSYEILFKKKRSNRIFTLTNIEHSHGAAATHLGLSVDRNRRIINTLAEKEIYKSNKKNVFHRFVPREEEVVL
ncbi:ornithine monooxygenase [Bacillus sp. OG2]|nr:ornithine monooxygenase [Bacillus sp. OG2]